MAFPLRTPPLWSLLTPPAPANCFLIPVSTLPGTHHSVWSSVHLSPTLMDLEALGGQQLSQKDLLPPPHLAKCPSSVVWFSAPPQKVAKSAGFLKYWVSRVDSLVKWRSISLYLNDFVKGKLNNIWKWIKLHKNARSMIKWSGYKVHKTVTHSSFTQQL